MVTGGPAAVNRPGLIGLAILTDPAVLARDDHRGRVRLCRLPLPS